MLPDTLSIWVPPPLHCPKSSLHCALEPTGILTLSAARASHAGPSLLTLKSTPQECVSRCGTESRGKNTCGSILWAWRDPSRQTSQTETLGRLHSPSPSGKSKAFSEDPVCAVRRTAPLPCAFHSCNQRTRGHNSRSQLFSAPLTHYSNSLEEGLSLTGWPLLCGGHPTRIHSPIHLSLFHCWISKTASQKVPLGSCRNKV